MIKIDAQELANVMSSVPVTQIHYYSTTQSSIIAGVEDENGTTAEGVTSTVELGLVGLSYVMGENSKLEFLEGCDEENPTILRLMFRRDDIEQLIEELQETIK